MQFHRIVKGMVLAAALVMALLTQPVKANEAQVKAALDLAPAEAPMVLVIPSVQTLDQQLSRVAQMFGGPNSVLAKMLEESGIATGLDQSGPVVLAFADAAFLDENRMDGADEPSIIALFKVKDYDGVVGKMLMNVKTEDGLQVGVNKNGRASYAKKIGDFAVISNRKDLMAKYAAGNASAKWMQAAGTLGAKTLANSDLAMVINVEAMAPQLKPKLDQFVDQMQKSMAMMQGGNGGNGGTPMPGPFQTSVVGPMYKTIGGMFLNDATVAVIGLEITDKGIGMAATTQFKPGSRMAKMASGAQSSAELLKLVPNQPYLMAMAINFKGLDLGTLMKEIVAAMPAEAPELERQMMSNAVAQIDQIESVAGGYYLAPRGTMGVQMITVAKVGDTASYMKATKEQFDVLGKISEQMNKVAAPPPADPSAAPRRRPRKPASPTLQVNYVQNAAQISGISADQFQYKLTLPPMPMNPLAGLVQSFTNMNGYVLAKDGYVIQAVNGEEALAETALKALAAGKGLGESAGMKVARERALGEKPVAEMYVNIEGFLRMFEPMMQMMGVTLPAAPVDMPPIAAGLNAGDNGMSMRMYVPQEVLDYAKSIKEEVEAAQQQRMNAQGGAPGTAPRRAPGN